jgi:hypothetical protein
LGLCYIDFLGEALVLCIGGLVLARWFLPTVAVLPEMPVTTLPPV